VTQVLTVTMRKQLKTIATTTSRSSSSLVRPARLRRLFDQRRPASAHQRLVARHAQQRVFGDFRRTGAYVPTTRRYNWHSHPAAIRARSATSWTHSMNRGIDGYTSSSVSSLGS